MAAVTERIPDRRRGTRRTWQDPENENPEGDETDGGGTFASTARGFGSDFGADAVVSLNQTESLSDSGDCL